MQKQKAGNFHTGSHSLLMKTSRGLGTSTETVFWWSIDTVLPPNTWKSPIAANPYHQPGQDLPDQTRHPESSAIGSSPQSHPARHDGADKLLLC